MLRQVLAQNPDDAFARYGLAMEHSRAGNIEAALAEFTALVTKHPNYVAGYQMAAQMLASAERNEDARAWLERGIAAAERSGNQHAKSEMEMLREEIR
jgi:predicted Zn-dependent protease